MDELEVLGKRLSELGSVAICFSGGRDSSTLAVAATKSIPDSHVAVFVDLPVLSRMHAKEAEAIAERIGCRFVSVRLGWDDVPGMCVNGPRRCYHCKRAIYEAAFDVAKDFGFKHVIAGENLDDASRVRPGKAAGDEMGVENPLVDVGFGDADIDEILSKLGFEDLVENTCMATRYPVGEELDDRCVEFAGECERAVLGVVNAPSLRVRIHGCGAVVEAYAGDLEKIKENLAEVESALGKMGFGAVSLALRE